MSNLANFYLFVYAIGAVVSFDRDGRRALLWPLQPLAGMCIVLLFVLWSIHRLAEMAYGLKKWSDPS